MPALKADIITQLKKDILALQGYRPLLHQHSQIELGTINHAFPDSQFPLGVNHEFICNNNESLTGQQWFYCRHLIITIKKRRCCCMDQFLTNYIPSSAGQFRDRSVTTHLYSSPQSKGN
jgi:hypothetical protein